MHGAGKQEVKSHSTCASFLKFKMSMAIVLVSKNASKHCVHQNCMTNFNDTIILVILMSTPKPQNSIHVNTHNLHVPICISFSEIAKMNS